MGKWLCQLIILSSNSAARTPVSAQNHQQHRTHSTLLLERTICAFQSEKRIPLPMDASDLTYGYKWNLLVDNFNDEDTAKHQACVVVAFPCTKWQRSHTRPEAVKDFKSRATATGRFCRRNKRSLSAEKTTNSAKMITTSRNGAVYLVETTERLINDNQHTKPNNRPTHCPTNHPPSKWTDKQTT